MRTLTITRTRCPTRPLVTTFATYVPSRVRRLPYRLCTLYSRSPVCHPSLSSLPYAGSRLGSGKRKTAFPSLSSWLPGSSSSSSMMSEKPEAGMPETIHLASKVGLRVLRVVAVRNVNDCCLRSADCGAAADGPGLPERVAEMYGSHERSFRSARGTFVARWKMISQVYRVGHEEDMGARRQLQMVVSPPFRTILTTSSMTSWS